MKTRIFSLIRRAALLLALAAFSTPQAFAQGSASPPPGTPPDSIPRPVSTAFKAMQSADLMEAPSPKPVDRTSTNAVAQTQAEADAAGVPATASKMTEQGSGSISFTQSTGYGCWADFYEHGYYNGVGERLRDPDHDPNGYTYTNFWTVIATGSMSGINYYLNGEISSIRRSISGCNGFDLIVYDQANLQGSSMTIDDDQDMLNNGWNDRIQSAEWQRKPGYYAPYIDLNGATSITIGQGDAYVEYYGWAWYYSIEQWSHWSDLSITGTVDSSTPGDYTITYTATDPTYSSLTTTATRTVHVVPQPPDIDFYPYSANLTLEVGEQYVEQYAWV